MGLKSQFLKLNQKDWLKALITTVIGAVCGSILATLQTGNPIDPTVVGTSAAIAGLSYVLKNLGTNSQDEFLKKENNAGL